MSTTTTNYNLEKFDENDYYQVDITIDKNLDIIDKVLMDNASFQTASGTATTITVITPPLVDGYAKTFIASASNGGASTTINGKLLYKPNTITPPNLIVGKAYTVWYDLSKDCFFIKASAEGDADKSHVLAGKKFSNDNDTGLVGTIPINGTLNKVLGLNETYNIPQGYISGGTVTQSIPTLGGQTIVPNTYNQVINAGRYLNADQIIQGDGNLNSANIISGKSIFGVWGNVTLESLGGHRTKIGTVQASGSGTITIPGFDFTPAFGFLMNISKNDGSSNNGSGAILYEANSDYVSSSSSNIAELYGYTYGSSDTDNWTGTITPTDNASFLNGTWSYNGAYPNSKQSIYAYKVYFYIFLN